MSRLLDLDVWRSTVTVAYESSDAIMDRLLDKNRHTMELELNLLEKFPELADDGVTYSFKLKEGIRFHDGAELTTEDVKYTFERFYAKEAANLNTFLCTFIVGCKEMMDGEADTLEGFTIIDKYNFTIKLERPFTAFTTILAVSPLPILPKHVVEAAGEEWGKSVLIGSGQYILEEFVPGVRLRMTQNPNYHGKVAEVDAIEIVHMNEDTALLEWEAGTIDVTPIFALDLVPDYLARFPRNVFDQEYIAVTRIQFNTSLSPLDDVNVRKAIALATKKTAITDDYYGGLVSVCHTMLPAGLPQHNPNVRESTYDPAAAKQL